MTRIADWRPLPRYENASEYHRAFEVGRQRSPYTYDEIGRDDAGRVVYGISFDDRPLKALARMTWNEYRAHVKTLPAVVGVQTLIQPYYADGRDVVFDASGTPWPVHL